MASNDTTDGDSSNATEYLLSELLGVVKDKIADDEAQVDWDPITFAFTVPVGVFGILATLFALVTIIQGILAASPGRRKSSRHVIGKKWANTRNTIFNWDELRTMTFVQTPILRAEALCKALQETGTRTDMDQEEKKTSLYRNLREKFRFTRARQETGTEVDPEENKTSLYRSLREKFRFTREIEEADVAAEPQETEIVEVQERTPVIRTNTQDESEEFSEETIEQTATKANWIRLLEHFNLDSIHFEGNEVEVTATDHIPDELRAVYAYTDVRTMIALGVVAGAMSLEPEVGSSYPILIGADIQIDFRQHPVLGTVAAFSKYGTREDQQYQSDPALSKKESSRYGRDKGRKIKSKPRQGPRTTQEMSNSSSPDHDNLSLGRQVMFALKHSNAEVEYVPPKQKTTDSTLSLPQTPSSNPPDIQLGLMKFINAIDDEGTNGRNQLPHTAQQILQGIEEHQEYCNRRERTLCNCESNWDRSSNHNLLWMFVAKIPSEAPAVFPSRAVAIRKSLTTLCLQSRFWSGDKAQQSTKSLYSVLDEVADRSSPPMQNFRDLVMNVRNNAHEDIILQRCLEFLHSRNESVTRDQHLNHIHIKSLLRGLDSMLDTVPESVLGCRRANLFLTTLILREVGYGIANGSFKASKENPQAPMHGLASAKGTVIQEHLDDLKQLDLYLFKGFEACLDEMPGNFYIMTFDVARNEDLATNARDNALVIFKRLQFVTAQCTSVARGAENQPQPDHPAFPRSALEIVDDLIIWRTILIGILFCSAPDNSKMYQSAVWNHVIPLL